MTHGSSRNTIATLAPVVGIGIVGGAAHARGRVV